MDLRRLTLHQLRVFHAVARHLSFTRAGEELLLTQSAVSAQVRVLTDLLGVPLFEQRGRRIYLTDAGRTLLEHARRLDAAVEALGDAFDALRHGTGGRVRVGASTSIGTYFLPFLIGGFSESHPGIDVALEIENSAHVQDRLLRSEFDVAYVGAPVTAPGLVAEAFLEDEILFACAPGHPLAASPRVEPQQLARHKLFVREPGSATRRTVDAYFRDRGLALLEPVQLGSVEAIKQSVLAGLGVAYFSELTVRKELAEGSLVRLAVRDARVVRTFFEVHHQDCRPLPALQRFTEFARVYARHGFGQLGRNRDGYPVRG